VKQAQAALVFAQQQAARFQDLAQKGAGTVQNAQQFTSQLHQQEAGLKTAQANLELTKRQLASLTAQRASAEATLGLAPQQIAHTGEVTHPLKAIGSLRRQTAKLRSTTTGMFSFIRVLSPVG
jgi:multidrug resistance efflux pump